MDLVDLAHRLTRSSAAAPQPGRLPAQVDLLAAVAAVFRPGPDLLFIRRAVQEGDPWSGHVAFPGGRFEAGDPTLKDTAVRETREEVGVDLAEGARFLGSLAVVRPQVVGVRSLEVHPFVFAVDGTVLASPSEEVAACFWVPLEGLLDGRGRSTMTWRYQGVDLPLPCIRWEGECIWGLTLRILDDLLGRLTAPA